MFFNVGKREKKRNNKDILRKFHFQLLDISVLAVYNFYKVWEFNLKGNATIVKRKKTKQKKKELNL